MHIKATAGGDSYRTNTVKLKAEKKETLTFTLEELFGSIEAIGLGSEITLEVTHVDSGEEASAPFRLTGSKDLKVGTGKYTVEVSIA